jgi:hypothetical protein
MAQSKGFYLFIILRLTGTIKKLQRGLQSVHVNARVNASGDPHTAGIRNRRSHILELQIQQMKDRAELRLEIAFMQSTSISWTDKLCGPVSGCSEHSSGLRVSRHARFFSAGALRGLGAARS